MALRPDVGTGHQRCGILFAGCRQRALSAQILPALVAVAERNPFQALRGKLQHADLRDYNMVQKIVYLLVLLDGVGLVFSGLVLWKPVQCSLLSTLLGGYEAARYIHFLCMSAMTLFIVIHLLMALLVPRTLLAMLRGC